MAIKATEMNRARHVERRCLKNQVPRCAAQNRRGWQRYNAVLRTSGHTEERSWGTRVCHTRSLKSTGQNASENTNRRNRMDVVLPPSRSRQQPAKPNHHSAQLPDSQTQHQPFGGSTIMEPARSTQREVWSSQLCRWHRRSNRPKPKPNREIKNTPDFFGKKIGSQILLLPKGRRRWRLKRGASKW